MIVRDTPAQVDDGVGETEALPSSPSARWLRRGGARPFLTMSRRFIPSDILPTRSVGPPLALQNWMAPRQCPAPLFSFAPNDLDTPVVTSVRWCVHHVPASACRAELHVQLFAVVRLELVWRNPVLHPRLR